MPTVLRLQWCESTHKKRLSLVVAYLHIAPMKSLKCTICYLKHPPTAPVAGALDESHGSTPENALSEETLISHFSSVGMATIKVTTFFVADPRNNKTDLCKHTCIRAH